MDRDSIKESWDAEYSQKTKEEAEQETEDHYKSLLPWDNLVAHDEKTVDVSATASVWTQQTNYCAKIIPTTPGPGNWMSREINRLQS